MWRLNVTKSPPKRTTSGVELPHLGHDLAIEIAADERGDVGVGEERDAITVQRLRQVVDEDLGRRDLDVVDIVVRAETAEDGERNVRAAQPDDSWRVSAHPGHRRLAEGVDADELEDPVAPHCRRGDQPR